jgi:hypothetical protein
MQEGLLTAECARGVLRTRILDRSTAIVAVLPGTYFAVLSVPASPSADGTSHSYTALVE